MNNHPTTTHGTTARFLFTTWEGGGNVAPAITVAAKLAERGHHVRFMSDETNRAEASGAGLEFLPWTTAPSRRDRTRNSCPVRDWEAKDPVDGIQRMMNGIMFGPAIHYGRDVVNELRREPADVVITSEMLLGVMAGCESLSQRFVVLSANVNFYPIAGMPAFGPGLPPPRDDAERAQHEAVIAGNQQIFDSGLPLLNQARAALGLGPIAHSINQLDAADLYLMGTSRSFDFAPARLPRKMRYAGPQLRQPAWAESWKSPWHPDDRRPLVLVGFSSSFQNHAGVVRNVIDALARLPVRGLVTLGGLEVGEVQPAANVVVVPSAPHDEILRHASLVITHGGHGTVMRALINGCPLLLVPHGRDQNDNAVRVTERGAGLTLDASTSASGFAYAVQRTLEDGSFKRGAGKLGKAIVREMRRSKLIEELERLAIPSQPPRISRLAAMLSFLS